MNQRRLYSRMTYAGLALSAIVGAYPAGDAVAAVQCERYVTANVVAIDQPVMFNRLGASNVNGMIFALRRDIVEKTSNLPEAAGGNLQAGNVALRPDKRPRPLVLRVRRGDCLTVNLTNLLSTDPNQGENPGVPDFGVREVNDQVADRHVSFHVSGMQYVNGPDMDDGAYVGKNADSTAAQGGSRTHVLYAEREGTFAVQSLATTVGSDANQGNSSNLLFGQVIVEPTGSAIYRGQVAEEEMRLAADTNNDNVLTGTEITAQGHPIIDYDKVYPNSEPWISEGKAGLPILNMMCVPANGCSPPTGFDAEIVHSEINAVVAYGPSGKMESPGAGPYSTAIGHFPPSTYPMEGLANMRNPTVPNRLEPFRDFASIYHDEPATKQAFPMWFDDRAQPTAGQFRYVLAGVKDGFMINYGSGGIGSEIIANRLRVGPMHDCLTCAYEEFFLTSFTVSDPATLVDIPANIGLENCNPSLQNCEANGPKANKALYTEDPANIHHSYTGDFTKIRNVHVGKEQHVFHLHNHQWLYNPNDDGSNYLDAQGIGPGVGYTYEINNGGSGNRNKTTGDAIYHCHFYPHFAQGMWYHWRNHDVFEAGTLLAVTPNDAAGNPKGFHVPFADDGLGLGDGTPATIGATTDGRPMYARSLPDAEVTTGVPIPAVVPLPGKPMAPMPGKVAVVPNTNTVCVGPAPDFGLQPKNPDGTCPGGIAPRATGSLAMVDRPSIQTAFGKTTITGKNPGYPFWIAGIEDVVGQRPPTPVLDMVDSALATNLNNKFDVVVKDAKNNTVATVQNLFGDLKPAQADGWDGGLPRGAMEGYAAGGFSLDVNTAIDFSKVVEEAQGVFYPEHGTDIEKLAMAYHAIRNHPSFLPDGTAGVSFVLNGQKPAVGAPFHEPCIADTGARMTLAGGYFFGSNLTKGLDPAGMTVFGKSIFNADNPRIYKGAQIQYDAVFNKAGYHYPQQRIIALWQDAVPVITKEIPGQPLVMRFNTFECGVYHHTNLTPEAYQVDDYQVRTPTDIIGQHIHLPKWDLTTADGAANGWNYEDGTLAAGAVRERIHALNTFLDAEPAHAHKAGTGSEGGFTPPSTLIAKPHPYFSTVAPDALAPLWIGARTTTQRWFVDPVVNIHGVDRGLGIIFSHDHYGPSTHQQIGLYATVLAEPAGSRWVNSETGAQVGYNPYTGLPTRTFKTADDRTLSDGGPTAWQAAILPPPKDSEYNHAGAGDLKAYREFYFEYSDFQHAYEAGVYVGAGQLGEPLPGAVAGNGVKAFNSGNPLFNDGVQGDATADVANAFRFAINPPARAQIVPTFPELVLELASTAGLDNFCPQRPCPQAIDVQDPGMHVINYRNEPVGLRIYDPNKKGPDGKFGMQASGPAGDLAFALQSRTDRAYVVPGVASFAPDGKVLNYQPLAGGHINGTIFPPPPNTTTALGPGDPFTPMIRTYAGDHIRVKMQAGGHEEEHNATIHGLKWLQAGSGHGQAQNSGWRNAQAGGISEQFTLSVPINRNPGSKKVVMPGGTATGTDYAYSMDASFDGWFSGMWGILRAYDQYRTDLFDLPSNPKPKTPKINNQSQFVGVCPANGNGTPKNLRPYQVVAMMANELLCIKDASGNCTSTPLGVTIPPNAPQATLGLPVGNVGGTLDPNGGTLVYNPRADSVAGNAFDPATGEEAGVTHFGPIHDPTALLYVHLGDLEAVKPNSQECADTKDRKTGKVIFPGLAKPACKVKLNANAPVEPLVLRAAAGDCIEVTLYNRLPQTVPDLPTYSTIQGVVKRDRGFDIAGAGSTTFQTNLFRPSSYVGLHPQLVEYDTSLHDGANVGFNPVQTVDPTVVDANGNPKPGSISQRTYRWYAGDVQNKPRPDIGPSTFDLVATPIEFGGSSLMPADTIKQGAKSLVGQLVIEPAGADWEEIADDSTGRQTATVTKADGTYRYRDFSAVFTKGLTHYYADGSPVEHMNGEGVGIPEDSQEASGMAVNYRVEPMWFRAGILPQSDFGHTGYGGIDDQYNLYSNTRIGGDDPATPVFKVNPAGKGLPATTPFRMRVTNPYGSSRGTTFQLHGHLWQRDPYICPGTTEGIEGRCAVGGVGSQMIGDNKQAFYQGAQESITPATHFEIAPTRTGPAGDYLFRDSGSFGNASGLWGIVRVEE